MCGSPWDAILIVKGKILSAKSFGNWSDFKLKPAKGELADDLAVLDDRSDISCWGSLVFAEDEDEEDCDADWLAGMRDAGARGSGTAGTGTGMTATGAILDAEA